MRQLICAVFLISAVLAAAPGSQPSMRIHAHNDYEHPRPLLDALDAGARSVEADVFLVNGQLLVAHESREIRADRSLRSLYLDPLRKRIQDHSGSIYGDGETLNLLIDIKSEREATYSAIRDLLKEYSETLTHYAAGKELPGPITVVLSGNQPSRKILTSEFDRLVACDGAISDLKTNPPVDLVPMICGKWGTSFKWDGTGTMSGDERSKLRDLVRQTHDQGRTIRFWGGPDDPAAWNELRSAGVDWINTDHLAEASQFIKPR